MENKSNPYDNFMVQPKVNGKPVPYLLLKSEKTGRYAGLASILSDLNFAKVGFDYLTKNPKAELSEYIWKSSLIAYARPFSSSKERRSRLHKNNLKSLDDNSLEVHMALLKMRNEHVAHFSTKDLEQWKIPLILEPQTLIPLAIGQAGYMLNGNQENDYHKISQLISKVIDIVTKKKESAAINILKENLVLSESQLKEVIFPESKTS